MKSLPASACSNKISRGLSGRYLWLLSALKKPQIGLKPLVFRFNFRVCFWGNLTTKKQNYLIPIRYAADLRGVNFRMNIGFTQKVGERGARPYRDENLVGEKRFTEPD